MLRIAALLLAATSAHAAVEPGNWEFSLESPLQNNNAPEVRQRCITPEQANDPQKVLEEVRSKNNCQISNLQDSGAEYRFDLAEEVQDLPPAADELQNVTASPFLGMDILLNHFQKKTPL